MLLFFPKLICFFFFWFRISPAFSLFFSSEMVNLIASAFLCPPFLLCSPQWLMVKSWSSRLFTWMSQIAHPIHFPCFTSTFEHWLSVCGNILNTLTIPGEAEDFVIVYARMRFQGYYYSFGSSSKPRKQDVVYFLTPRLLLPIERGCNYRSNRVS